MTTSHPPSFSLTVEVETTEAVVRVVGDLDYETCDELVSAVRQTLAGRAGGPDGVQGLHVDFAGLDNIDSMGLSALLMIRRQTDAAGIRLYLDERPAGLERLLDITGTLAHLTAPCDVGRGEQRPGAG
ncbi:STAS domain-containing protein [Streptomyces sp. NPDC005813]|uniref:STAS domain-containing protein n=1 Tax=Streptomyces sp. NPDC005813 TaxID=3155592 RepID=UPI0033FB02D1